MRVEFYSQTDKNRRNAKNVPLILDDDKPPEPRPVQRAASETPAAPVRTTDQNHFYYMFFGKSSFFFHIFSDDVLFSFNMYSSSLAV